jgi:hypothetical protein
METGVALVFGCNAFKRALPRHIFLRTGIRRDDWEALVTELNFVVRKEIPWWSYVFPVFVAPLLTHLSAAIYAGYRFHLSSAILLTILDICLLPASCFLLGLLLVVGRVQRAVTKVKEVLPEINERYRALGFDFSLMDKRDYAKKYLTMPRRRNVGNGYDYVLLVRRLTSYGCGLGGQVCKEFATEAPGEWIPDDSRLQSRRKSALPIHKRPKAKTRRGDV